MDERQLDAHLTQALGREARLWQGGQIQVPVPASGLPGSVFIPVLTRTRFAAGLHLHPRSGEQRLERAPSPGASPRTKQEAGFADFSH